MLKMVFNMKVNQSHYRPGVVHRVHRKLRFPDYMKTA
jgi:hypothetical protein